uniref:(northern house mosquito) hypothetical protein n=1 Tax=Culex pipiens TaxID=7175 RepID=A0A8D8FS33_CULPI
MTSCPASIASTGSLRWLAGLTRSFLSTRIARNRLLPSLHRPFLHCWTTDGDGVVHRPATGRDSYSAVACTRDPRSSPCCSPRCYHRPRSLWPKCSVALWDAGGDTSYWWTWARHLCGTLHY